jgi:hypothetical protein
MLRTRTRQLQRKISLHKSKIEFIYKQKSRRHKLKQGALRVFRLTFKPLSYKPRDVLDTSLGSLHNLLSGPLHDRFKGDPGVPAPETHQHELHNCLHQDTTLHLESVTDGVLQLGHLDPSRVKKMKHGILLLHRDPRTKGTEAEGHQGSLNLAQEVPDSLRVSYLRCLEILQPLLSGSQLLHLPLRLPPLLVRQLYRSGIQVAFPDIGSELMSRDYDMGVLQSLTLCLKSMLIGLKALKLPAKIEVVQLLTLQQSLLQLFHRFLPLTNGAHTHGEVLLLLNHDVGPGLGGSIQLLGVGRYLLRVNITSVDASELHIQQLLPLVKILLPHHHSCPLRGHLLLKQGSPKQKTLALIVDTPLLVMEHPLRLVVPTTSLRELFPSPMREGWPKMILGSPTMLSSAFAKPEAATFWD